MDLKAAEPLQSTTTTLPVASLEKTFQDLTMAHRQSVTTIVTVTVDADSDMAAILPPTLPTPHFRDSLDIRVFIDPQGAPVACTFFYLRHEPLSLKVDYSRHFPRWHTTCEGISCTVEDGNLSR
jgi:hypothetical protein